MCVPRALDRIDGQGECAVPQTPTEESSVPIEAPGTTFLNDLYPRFVVAVQEFISHLSLREFCKSARLQLSVPLNAHNSDEPH